MASAVTFISVVIVVVALDPVEWPGWLLDDPTNLSRVVWIAAAAVVGKCGLAAYTWRRIAARYVRTYLIMWFGATASLVGLAVIVLGIAQVYVPTVSERLWILAILLAVMTVPLARVGLSTSQLTRNRHRSGGR
jgi:hypothetical protein